VKKRRLHSMIGHEITSLLLLATPTVAGEFVHFPINLLCWRATNGCISVCIAMRPTPNFQHAYIRFKSIAVHIQQRCVFHFQNSTTSNVTPISWWTGKVASTNHQSAFVPRHWILGRNPRYIIIQTNSWGKEIPCQSSQWVRQCIHPLHKLQLFDESNKEEDVKVTLYNTGTRDLVPKYQKLRQKASEWLGLECQIFSV